jgi:polyvinyl alcohol dehydrogenase (cytochrome)
VAIAVAALGIPSTATADWPIYGHDLANSRNAGDAGPAAGQVGSMTRAWTFNASTGSFTGTPVVADGVVVVGNHGGWIYALDAVSGKVLWDKDVGSPVNGSAAIDLDAPGGPAVYVPVAQIGSPRLLALSLDNGATRWDTVLTKQADSSVFGSAVFSKGTLYIGTSGPNNDDSRARGSVVALNQATGKIRWQTFTVPEGRDGAAVWSTPAIDEPAGRLYVGTGNNYHQPTTDMENSILALDTATGNILAHFQATPNDAFAADNPTGPDFDFGASPNLFEGPNGQRLVGEGQKSGVYWALDRATMQPVWQTMVGPGGILGGILGSTAYDGTRIYGADTIDGEVFALGRDGSITWESPDTGFLHLSAASIANGVLYTTDPNGALNARDPATGAILARLPLDGPTFGGVSAAGGAVYVAVGTGPPPEPAPQMDGPGSIVAFGDTSTAGPSGQPGAGPRAGRLRLSVRPRRVRAGRLVRLRFRALNGGRAVAGARVHVAGRRLRTGRDGRATLRVRFGRTGLRSVRASRHRLGRVRVTVRVLPRR